MRHGLLGKIFFRESLEVRKRIGYMPENVPLYTDMMGERNTFDSVEVLRDYRGGRLRKRLSEVMETCGLTHVPPKK